jgi:hypothetical protein
MKTAKKKHPPSPKLLAHLKRLNLSRRKKGKKPAAAKKPTKPKAVKPAKAKKTPAPKPVVLTPIPPVELPKGDAPGQTTMPIVEAAVAPQPATAAPAGEELL